MAIMKTTVKHVGSVREWEGPEDASIAHRSVIEHWCDGGQVEIFFDSSWVEMGLSLPEFNENYKYRIKQREPKPGEVWANGYGPWVYRTHGSWSCLIDGKSSPEVEDKPMTYAAPSGEAYYARKFHDQVYGDRAIVTQTMADEKAYKLVSIVEEASNPDK